MFKPRHKREDLPDEFIATRVVFSPWRPAQRFWDAFQVVDPLELLEFSAATETSTYFLRQVTLQVLSAPPAADAELYEKIKIGIVVGYATLIDRATDDDFRDGVRETGARLMLLPARQFVKAFARGLEFDDFDDLPASIPPSEWLLCAMRCGLSRLHPMWRRTLADDARRLQWRLPWL